MLTKGALWVLLWLPPVWWVQLELALVELEWLEWQPRQLEIPLQ
jgi:hypothetical protein